MVVANLTISKDRKMHWDANKEKMGTREERHSLGRFVIDQACHLPITVRVRRKRDKHRFRFQPVLINEVKKKVVLYHKRYAIFTDFDDVVSWIQIFIRSNKMYEQDMFKYYI